MWGAITNNKTKLNALAGFNQVTQSNNAQTAHLSSKLGIVAATMFCWSFINPVR
jgi:hypothetical protein